MKIKVKCRYCDAEFETEYREDKFYRCFECDEQLKILAVKLFGEKK